MKKFKTLKIAIVLISSLLLINCTPSENDNNKAPSIFSANTTDTSVDGATIEWTESNDADGDNVTYAVFLEGKAVVNGISALTYTFTGLEPETSYTGYIEARDGKGGTNKATFSFTTEPELIIKTIDVSIVEESNGVSFKIDAVFIIEPVKDAKTYKIEVLEMKPDSNPSRVGINYTWNSSGGFNSSKIKVNGNGNYVFYGMDYGAGLHADNGPGIIQARGFYSGVTGKAKVTITVGK